MEVARGWVVGHDAALGMLDVVDAALDMRRSKRRHERKGKWRELCTSESKKECERETERKKQKRENKNSGEGERQRKRKRERCVCWCLSTLRHNLQMKQTLHVLLLSIP